MKDDKSLPTSGQPAYLQNTSATEETSGSGGAGKPEIDNLIHESHTNDDIERFSFNRPYRDKIDAIIIAVEHEKPCITSQETKTTD